MVCELATGMGGASTVCSRPVAGWLPASRAGFLMSAETLASAAVSAVVALPPGLSRFGGEVVVRSCGRNLDRDVEVEVGQAAIFLSRPRCFSIAETSTSSWRRLSISRSSNGCGQKVMFN
jgi:hypothetical protein